MENQTDKSKQTNTAVSGATQGSEPGLLDWHRLSILYDGTEILRASTQHKHPENSEQMNALLRELIAVSEAPSVPDPEVLGDRSPNELSSPTAGGGKGGAQPK